MKVRKNVLIVAQPTLGGLHILILKQQIKNLRLIMHRRNGRTAIVPRATPAAIVDTKVQKRKPRIAAHLTGEDLIQRNAIHKIGRFRTGRAGEKRLFRVMITRLHARMEQVLEHCHLFQRLHPLQVIGRSQVAAFVWEEIRLIKPEATVDENDPAWRRLGSRLRPLPQRLQGQRQRHPHLQKFIATDHFASPSSE